MSESQFIKPDNWLELLRAAVDEGWPYGPAHYELMAHHPFFRRHSFGSNGGNITVALTALDEIVFTLTPAEEEALENLAPRNILAPLILEIADGAFLPTASSKVRVQLQALRDAAAAHVTVQLWWPRFTSEPWRWFRAISWGTTIEREAAFVSGVSTPRSSF